VMPVIHVVSCVPLMFVVIHQVGSVTVTVIATQSYIRLAATGDESLIVFMNSSYYSLGFSTLFLVFELVANSLRNFSSVPQLSLICNFT